MAKRVYLYAFNKVLRVVDTKFLEGEAISVRDMLRLRGGQSAGTVQGIHGSGENEGLHETC